MTDAVQARAIVVLADCHIHPAQGLDWPLPALEAFKGADLFVTLGDMGEKAGLDTLARLAPVIGVRGGDDEADLRTAAKCRVLEVAGSRSGCIFDPVEAGIALQADPPIGAGPEKVLQLFGVPLDVVLWASTHAPSMARIDGQLWLNPGSVRRPAKHAPACFT